MTLDLRSQLDALLSEDVAEAQRRLSHESAGLASRMQSPIVLLGAGLLGQHALAGLRTIGCAPVAFADNSPARWGTSIDGVTVLSPDVAAQRFGETGTFVATVFNGDGPMQQLADLGCAHAFGWPHLFALRPDAFLPYGTFGLPEQILPEADAIRAAFALYADDLSRVELLGRLRLSLRLDFSGLAPSAEHEIYFPEDLFALSPDEVFVDCGAFDGDTVARFLDRSGSHFAELVAIEPDPLNMAALERNVAALPEEVRSRITLLQVAASDRSQRLTFASTGTGASALATTGGVEVQALPLDECLAGKRPSYIKFDVEAAEPEALAGARHIVEGLTPVMAISVYHRPQHPWQMPLQADSYCEQYRFFLRTYGPTGIDAVCYAVPLSRCLHT